VQTVFYCAAFVSFELGDKILIRRVRCRLAQLVRFLVVELTYPDLNLIFNINIIFITNYFFNKR
jgi:hypothetical protein